MKMKKIMVLLLAVITIMAFAACSAGGDSGKDSGGDSPKNTETLNLEGNWKQKNSNSDTSYQRAVITSDTIEIYWVTDGDTESLYWAGSYVKPTTSEDKYTWDSVNDKEKTGSALLASGDDTKTFTYEKGEISYSISAMGTTTTVKLEKQ